MWIRSTPHALAASCQAACVQALRQLAVASPSLVAETLHNLFNAMLDADVAPSAALSKAIAEVMPGLCRYSFPFSAWYASSWGPDRTTRVCTYWLLCSSQHSATVMPDFSNPDFLAMPKLVFY